MQKSAIHLVAALLGTLVLTGCATVEKMDQPTYQRLHAKATKAFEKSQSVQYAWTTAEDALEKAESAAKEGDWETAIKQVKRAHQQSDLAYKQYESEKNSEPSFN